MTALLHFDAEEVAEADLRNVVAYVLVVVETCTFNVRGAWLDRDIGLEGC